MGALMNDKSRKDVYNLTELQFIEAISNRLRTAGWRVQEEANVGTWQPDLVVKAPSGESFLVECKFTAEDVDFSTVDHVLKVSDDLKSRLPNQNVHPVLVTLAPATGIVAQVSEDSGLAILPAQAGPDRVASWLVEKDQE
jgi:hypothetical protein